MATLASLRKYASTTKDNDELLRVVEAYHSDEDEYEDMVMGPATRSDGTKKILLSALVLRSTTMWFDNQRQHKRLVQMMVNIPELDESLKKASHLVKMQV